MVYVDSVWLQMQLAVKSAEHQIQVLFNIVNAVCDAFQAFSKMALGRRS